MVYPIYRAESKENFERLLRQDERNARFISGEEPEKTVATAEPEHFIDHYYVVEDLQVRGALQLKEYSTFEDAMRAYKSLPSERMKALGVQNTRTPFPGSLDLIQCKDGEDKLVQDYTKVAGWENPEILDLVQKIETAIQTKESPDIPAINFHITNDHLGEGGAKAKFRANMDAIRVLKELEFDERNATPEEQEILSQYVGWGGLAAAFDENKASWAEEFRELYTALSPEEYAAARASTLNAHYTSPTVIRAIYDAVGQMGFEPGNILEPAMGIGNFFGMLPDAMRNSNLYGVELDSISGRIAQKLYPNAEIKVAGFETTDRRDFYDLAVGNVPFGNYKVSDKPYDKLGFSIHNYFFAKTLDQVRPGGVVAFVTSRFTMDSKNSDITGRQQKNDIIAYQIRQSFKPGEITPEEANQVGYETAMRWTKGKHAFIVATHIDRSHIHNHIIYNSTSLDCTRKFKNFFLSGLAVQRLSDMVCIEHGLSIIEPKPYRERVKRTIYPKKRTKRDELCAAIDQILKKKPKDFSDFVFQLSELGYEFKDGKQPAFRHSGEKRFIRLRSLGEGYSQEDIIAILSGKSVQKASRASRQVHTQREFNLLIDIQEKMAEGKSAGYERWAKKYNRKEAARTVCLLKEKGISNYEELTALTEQLSSRFAELSDTIKANEKRMVEIGALQTHINNYSRTRSVYEAYRKSGYSIKFFEEHREEIQIHKAAKKAFDQLPGKKVPTRQSLNEEYHRLLSGKKEAYAEYRQVKKDMQEYLIAKQTVEHILGIDRKNRIITQQQNLD